MMRFTLIKRRAEQMDPCATWVLLDADGRAFSLPTELATLDAPPPLYVTDAPRAYDHASYTREVLCGPPVVVRSETQVQWYRRHQFAWRLLAVLDLPRFRDFQAPRYRSGFFWVGAVDDINLPCDIRVEVVS